MAIKSGTSISSEFVDLSSHRINLATMLLNEGADKLGVELLSASGHRKVKVQQEEPFYKPVDRKVASNNVREELENVEEGEHSPISQPLRVIILMRGFNSFDRNVSRIEESSKVAK